MFDILPGVVLPVREVTSRLASMWETDSPDSPLAFHASQMNVILHFGPTTKLNNVRSQFDALIRFAQRYPCRIIVLCPTSSNPVDGMKSKLFSQCYIGKSHREMCCCEALILPYNPMNSEHLFNQVSIWLEGDLPVYYWFSEMSVQHVERHLDEMRKLGVRRCVFDSSENSGQSVALHLPDKIKTGDLAAARLLPMRQIIGQFLSQYTIATICEGLKSIQVCHKAASGEASSLLEWVKACLDRCSMDEPNPSFLLKEAQSGSSCLLELEFVFSNEKYFICKWLNDDLRCELKAVFGEGPEWSHVPIKPLTDEQALAEAFFHI